MVVREAAAPGIADQIDVARLVIVDRVLDDEREHRLGGFHALATPAGAFAAHGVDDDAQPRRQNFLAVFVFDSEAVLVASDVPFMRAH